MDILISFVILIISLVVLIKSSDFFVTSIAKLSKLLGISELVIGMSVIAIGTSLPELGASVIASYLGNTSIAIGNIIGSNLANIGLIIGISAIITPLSLNERIYKQDAVLLILVTLVFYFFSINGMISRSEGVFLLIFFVIYILYMFKADLLEAVKQKKLAKSHLGITTFDRATAIELIIIVVSFFTLIYSAKFLVESASDIAFFYGVPESMIAILLISIGTSIPELMIAITSIRKKMSGLLIGNIIGSNISNMLLIGGAAAVINPITFTNLVPWVSIPAMIMLTSLMLVFMRNRAHISRSEGIALIAGYIALIVLIIASTQILQL